MGVGINNSTAISASGYIMAPTSGIGDLSPAMGWWSLLLRSQGILETCMYLSKNKQWVHYIILDTEYTDFKWIKLIPKNKNNIGLLSKGKKILVLWIMSLTLFLIKSKHIVSFSLTGT